MRDETTCAPYGSLQSSMHVSRHHNVIYTLHQQPNPLHPCDPCCGLAQRCNISPALPSLSRIHSWHWSSTSTYSIFSNCAYVKLIHFPPLYERAILSVFPFGPRDWSLSYRIVIIVFRLQRPANTNTSGIFFKVECADSWFVNRLQGRTVI